MKRSVPLMILAFLAISRATFADTVDLTLNNAFGDGIIVTTSDQLRTENTIAGPYTYTLANSSNPNLVPNGPYSGFCVALTTNIGYGQTANFTVQRMSDFTLGNGNDVLQLFNDYIAAGGDTIHPAQHNTVSDALTIAVWDVLNATSSSLQIGKPGNISLSWGPGQKPPNGTTAQDILNSDRTDWAVSLANTWLASLDSGFSDPNSTLTNGDTAYALMNTTVQSQSIVIGLTNTPHFHPVPEPSALLSLASLALFGVIFGGGGLLFYRRRSNVMSRSSRFCG